MKDKSLKSSSGAVMSSRLAAELDYAFERNNWTAEMVKKLSAGDILSRIVPVLRGDSEIVIKTHSIDCDADPFSPDGWKVEEHIKGGQLVWNLDQVKLYLCDKQKHRSIEGNKLRKKLEGKSVLNACVLDYLLANPQLIPEEWKDKYVFLYVFFWGTVYRDSGGDLCVRYLCWDDGRWYWRRYWLVSHWRDSDPAALSCK